MVEFEIADMLVSLLCPTSNAASQCQSFLSASQHQVLMPVGPYIYFLLFPTVFLLFFLWIIFGQVVKGNTAINFLGAIAVYVFVIISGFYPLFLWLGEFWIIVIFLLGFLYALLHRWRGGGEGKKSGGMAAKGGAATTAGYWMKEAMFGTTPIDPRERARQNRLLKEQLHTINSKIKKLEGMIKPGMGDKEKSEITSKLAELAAEREAVEIKYKSVGGR